MEGVPAKPCAELFKDPKLWRDRAEKTKAKARSYGISKIEKKKLLKIATEYDHLAERAEEWLAISTAHEQDIDPAQTSEAK
jgi:hypothetical protein